MGINKHQKTELQELQKKDRDRKTVAHVSLEQMTSVADLHAHEVWGDPIGRGQPLPITNVEGKLIHLAFPFAVGRREFPEADSLGELLDKAGAVHEDQVQAAQTSGHSSRAPAQEDSGRFGMVYVSTTKDNYPVTRISHGLHPGFYNVARALKVAREQHGMSRPSLRQICLESPFHEYFEIVDGRRSVRLQVNSLLSSKEIQELAAQHTPAGKPFQKATHKNGRPEAISSAWKGYQSGRLSLPPTMANGESPKHGLPLPLPWPDQMTFEYLIPYHELIPPLLWTRWCAPTAAAMVLAFWDHYVPTKGTWPGYGRIVDYWLDHPHSSHNVPNLLDEVVDDLSGGSWETAMQYFSDKINGYDWSYEVVRGDLNNEWAWDTLLDELHAGRPVKLDIFAPDPVPGHAICVFGYRVVLAGSTVLRYLILYNTWTQTRDEWLIDQYYWYGGGETDFFEVCCYRPGGADPGTMLVLLTPNGGESYAGWQKNDIKFYAGPDIKVARIEYSVDGGQTWHFVVEMVVNHGWNHYYWNFPIMFATKARIRIKGLSADREYLAGTGSFENFSIWAPAMAIMTAIV